MTDWRIPLSDVDFGREEEQAVAAVVRSGWLTLGAQVDAFEREFAELCGVETSVAVSSCSAALHLACLALGVGPGDEVIVPTLTFVAGASAIVAAGGRPVFADSIGPEDFTIDPDDVVRRITPATRGVMCVHYGGYACRLDALLEICRERGLFLIEDAAHAPGAEWNGRALGTWGQVGCFSFFGNKNMTTGEGGIAIAADEALEQRLRRLRSHGMTASSWDRFRGHAYDYDVVEVGYNYRPTELTGALGRAQVRKLAANNERRNRLLDRYRVQLAEVPGVAMPFAQRRGVAHLAVALLPDRQTRDGLRQALAAARIQSSLHYPPIHLFRHYREKFGLGPGECPVAEDLAARAVTLPLYATMEGEQVDEVCACIRDFLSARASGAGGARPAGGAQTTE